MSKLQVVQRFAKEFSVLIADKTAVITLVNDKICINGVEANEEMQAFYNQLTNAKLDEAVKMFNDVVEIQRA